MLGNGLSETCIYDADGIRVKKTSSGVSTYYPFPHYEVTVAASGTITATAYYHFNGQPVAMRQGDTLTYLHTDHLGSVALTTGGSTVEQRYFAYGRQRTGGDLPSEHNYTGQRKDASGLLYYNARYYDPQLGTFISPDTIVPDPFVLSDYNRYAYVRGNPLKLTDPDGQTPWDVVDAIFWAMSARDMYNDPSWGNAGWLAVDTLTMLPVIPSIGGWVRRGSEATKISNQARRLVARHGMDTATEFLHIAHKPGSETLLQKLATGAANTAKGGLFELEYARKYTDEIVQIGRTGYTATGKWEIDFVLEGNVFVNTKNYDWGSKYYELPFAIPNEIARFLDQVDNYREYGEATDIRYIFKGGVPDAVREALEAAGVIVEVIQ